VESPAPLELAPNEVPTMPFDSLDPIDVARFHVVCVAKVLVMEHTGSRPALCYRERMAELVGAVSRLQALEHADDVGRSAKGAG
jgi:hypothetical protein